MTKCVQDRANELLRDGNRGVKRVPFAAAVKAASTHQEDFVLAYVNDLRNVIDMDAIRAAGLPSASTRWAARRSIIGNGSMKSMA